MHKLRLTVYQQLAQLPELESGTLRAQPTYLEVANRRPCHAEVKKSPGSESQLSHFWPVTLGSFYLAKPHLFGLFIASKDPALLDYCEDSLR